MGRSYFTALYKNIESLDHRNGRLSKQIFLSVKLSLMNRRGHRDYLKLEKRKTYHPFFVKILYREKQYESSLKVCGDI